MTTIVETSQQQPYTILRIKRKRNEEPLDGLVIESAARRKKSRVFQFAQTVEDAAWADEEVKAQIQAEVSRLSSVPLTNQVTNPPVKTRRPSNLRRYTVIEQENSAQQETFPQPKTAPASVPEPTAKFTMLDAVPEGPSEMDLEMEKIMPMLQAYLNIHEPALTQQEPDNDYVWDLYHLSHPTSSDWNSAATVGTLTGLPPSLNDPDSSDSDSEVEDEADEDSNAEEYFANDYPDEEESSDFESDSNSSDEFHESNSDRYNSDN